ncbi:sugar ABC transporter substrate-binding protein [Georgenia sp. EYE_87]|uniref:ABC transporter substrate-binding protein n=1 Tax=Georgenia sp. EYE_87 TaxID=2853448 RepID=UPI0020046A08|nr:sugar ABC transporter substrate-binding protein [Georgenia sp. EYE_87]MCK6210555.1 sugar ABC transporter substrate-binding protein [Georgenia sp. EYE_87]
MQTRKFLVIGTSAALVTGLAACGTSDDSAGGDSGKITVLMEDISYTDNIKTMLPEFEESTGIDVTIETVPYSDQAAKILQEFSQESDYYDAVFTDNVYGSGYFESGYIQDLAPLAESDTEFGDLDAFYDPYIAPMSTDNGAVYGLPVYGESTFLMYRTDLFEEHGIAGPPQTTDELMEAARTISEGSGGEVAGITMRGAPGIQSVYPWAGLLRSFGGDFFDADGKSAINSPEAVEAAEYWSTLLREYGASGAANFDWEQNRIAFTQGRAAMTIDATANGPFNEDPESSTVAGKVGYAAIPYADGVESGENTNNSLNVHALYLSSFSENPEETYKFMSWATSLDVQENAVATTEAVGVTLESVLTGSEYQEKYGAFQEAVLSQLETGNVDYLPSGQNANVIIVETGQALSNILSGQTSASDALNMAAENINRQLG